MLSTTNTPLVVSRTLFPSVDKPALMELVKLENKGIATSGLYIRGNHIYDPHRVDDLITDIASITIIGPTVYDADRFATAAFATKFPVAS